jgi:hypothetical protein
MTDTTFRIRLMALLNEYLEEGGDPFWLFNELNTAGRELTDSLRCELEPREEVTTREANAPW